MRKIEAIIKHYKPDDVKKDLTDGGVRGMTITDGKVLVIKKDALRYTGEQSMRRTFSRG